MFLTVILGVMLGWRDCRCWSKVWEGKNCCHSYWTFSRCYGQRKDRSRAGEDTGVADWTEEHREETCVLGLRWNTLWRRCQFWTLNEYSARGTQMCPKHSVSMFTGVTLQSGWCRQSPVILSMSSLTTIVACTGLHYLILVYSVCGCQDRRQLKSKDGVPMKPSPHLLPVEKALGSQVA